MTDIELIEIYFDKYRLNFVLWH